MIFFIMLIFPTSLCQKLIIDSRQFQHNEADLKFFKSKFSIWFTTQTKSDQNYDIFQIMQKENLNITVSSSQFELLIYDNKVLRQQINYDQFNYTNQWYHIIITQYDEQYVVFDLNFIQLTTKQSIMNFNYTIAVKNETKIFSNKNKNYFCLIYDSITMDQQPIIQKTIFNTFINPSIIQQLLFYNNSSAILFLRKFQQEYKISHILSLFMGEYELFQLIEKQTNLYIIFGENLHELGQVNDQSFSLQIDVQKENIQKIIQIINRDYQFEIITKCDQIFYTLILLSTYSNFEHLQIIQTYKERLEDVDKQLFDVQCDNYKYYDSKLQKCIDKSQIYQSQVIQDDQTQLQLNYIMADNTNKYIKNLIFQKIVMSLVIDDVQSTLFINKHLKIDQNQQSKSVYVLLDSREKIICQQFYFGSNCLKYVKKCILMRQNICLACVYGYFDSKFICKRCPKGCQVCQLINRKLICLLSIRQYYVDIKGLIQICNCIDFILYYHSNKGECLNLENVMEIVENCQQNTQCIIKKCLPQQYLRLKNKKCITLPQDIEIILYQYVVDYNFSKQEILELQYKIILITQMDQKAVNANKRIQQLYFASELLYKYNILLQTDLSKSQYHIMNRYNLSCLDKTMNSNGDLVCQKYQNDNIVQDLQYQFTLNLHNVSLYYDIIEYQKQQFSTLTHLLQQIKDVGVEYTNINIELNVQYEYQYNYKSQQAVIYVDKSELPAHVKFANLHLFLKFSYVQDSSYHFILDTDIDFIHIIDQILQYSVYLRIQNCYMVIFKNFTMAIGSEIKLLGQFIDSLIFLNVILKSQFLLTFNYIDNIDILSSDFYFSLENPVIQFDKLKNLNIQSCQFDFQNTFNNRFITTYQIQNVTFENLLLNIENTSNTILISYEKSNNIILKQISVYGSNSYQSLIFQTSFSMNELIDELKIEIQNFRETTFYTSKFTQQFQLYDCLVQGREVQQTQFFRIQSINSIIKQNIYFMEISQQNIILSILSKALIIENFFLKQASNMTSLNDIIESQYNYSYQLRMEYGLIQNFSIYGEILQNQGLISFQVSEKAQINNLIIQNISFIQDSLQSLIQLQDFNNYPKYYINNMTIRNINSIIKNHNIIININQAFIISIINITLEQIQSSIQKGYLLRTLSIETKLQNLTIINCKGQNFMDVQSQVAQINNLYLQQNLLLRIFNLKAKINFFLLQNCYIQNSTIINEFMDASQHNNISLKIIIENMKFDQIQSQTELFNIQGDHIYFIISDFKIQRQYQDFIGLNKNSIFKVVSSKFFSKNFIVDNIKDSLYYFFTTNYILLNNIQIQNINESKKVMIQIVNSPIIIKNLKVYYMSNCRSIIKIKSDNENQYLYINNFLLYKLKNITEVITHFQPQENKQLFSIQNLVLIESEIVYLFYSISQQQQVVRIQNLFNNQGKFLIQIHENTKFCFINSIISDATFKVINQDNVILKSIEVIETKNQYINLITDNKIPQFMTLSFDGGRNLLKVKQLNDSFSFIIDIINQNASFFYIRSGQKLSYYKRLNLKQLSYEQIYQGLSLIIKGNLFQSDMQYICYQQQFYNEQIINYPNSIQNFIFSEEQYNLDQIFIINPHNNNYTVFKINCQFNNQTLSLQYNVKSFPCQLGEYIYKNQFLQCNVSQQQYSVIYNATKCQQIDICKIKAARYGLIELHQGYWRYKYDSHVIEFCDSNYCNGGWIPGDQSCVKQRTGALCIECDLYNVRGDGSSIKTNGECSQCQQLNIKFVLQFLFVVLFQQLFAIIAYYSNRTTSNQYLFYKIGFKQFYQILYRQSVDQPSIIIKMYANYLFMLYVIRDNFDNIGKLFVVNMNFINNPSLILSQQSCILSQLSQFNIIYSQFFYEIFLTFFITSVTYAMYLITVLLKTKQFSIGFIIFFMDSIFVYNLKIIIETATNLLSYNEISQQKWIRLNVQYLFYSETHMQMIKYIIPITVTIFLFPMVFPFLSKNLKIITRKAIRIFSIYFQEYKPQFFYWEYCIIYTKYIIMILQIQENNSIYLKFIVIQFIVWASYTFKPYYLQNLNTYESNLLFFYSIQLNFVIQSNWVSILIIGLNTYLLFQFVRKTKNSYYLLHKDKIIFYKQKIIEKFPKLNNIIKININLQQERNRKLFIQITRQKIMKKQYISQKSFSVYQLETEIELVNIKQSISKNYPSLQE